jgi:hypothetical protein
MLDEFYYGRKDAASAQECGSTKEVSQSSYVANLQAKGFTEEEIVALASVEGFNVTRDPEQARWSSFPKFDNFYYKQVLTNAQGVPLSQALNSSPALMQHVQKFAEDNAAYHASFKKSFVKLCDLGSNPEKLVYVEEFLMDDPRGKLRFPDCYQ